jgi:hypothetical protein
MWVPLVQEMLQDVPAVDSSKLALNPLDEKYNTLQADLTLLIKSDPTYKVCRIECLCSRAEFEFRWNAKAQCMGHVYFSLLKFHGYLRLMRWPSFHRFRHLDGGLAGLLSVL